MDKYERWEKIITRYNNIYINEPWSSFKGNSFNWGTPSTEDILFYSNLIKHSSIVLNIASTVAIDAAVLDIPTICLGFHPTEKQESKLYYDYHFTEHYKDITSMESVDLATSKENFIELFHNNLNDNTLKRSNRENLVKYYLGDSTLGRSSDIIAKNLIDQ